MTLATLKGMNFNMGDVANAFKLKAADTMFTGVQKVGEKAAGAAKPSPRPPRGPQATAKAARKSGQGRHAGDAGVVDPLQWWGALTQQFQQIAASAMKDARGPDGRVDREEHGHRRRQGSR